MLKKTQNKIKHNLMNKKKPRLIKNQALKKFQTLIKV
jgi:hypothetical protein